MNESLSTDTTVHQAELQAQYGLGEKFLQPGSFYAFSVRKGEWDPSFIKNHELSNLSDSDRHDAVEAIKVTIKNKVNEIFDQENEANGLKGIAEDVARVKQYLEERKEVVPSLESFSHYAVELKNEYKQFFASNTEMSNLVNSFYNTDSEGRDNILIYLDTKTKIIDYSLVRIKDAIQVDLEYNPEVPDLAIIKDYIKKARDFNDTLINLIRNNDIKVLKEIFNKDIPLSEQKYFGFNPRDIAAKFETNQRQPLIRSHGSLESKFSFSVLNQHLQRELENQKKIQEDIYRFINTGVDMVALKAEADHIGKQPDYFYSIQKKIDDIEAEKKEAEHIRAVVRTWGDKIQDRMGEEVTFEIKSMETQLKIPKFTSEIEDINRYSETIMGTQLHIAKVTYEIFELENKKLGLFEFKTHRAAKLLKAQEELKGLEKVLKLVENQRKSLSVKPFEPFNRIWDANPKINLTEAAGLSGTMTLEKMFDKINTYINSLSTKTISPEEANILKNYTDTQKLFEESRQVLLAPKAQ